MWRVTLRGFFAHKLRLALTALAIALGVAFVSGTLVLTDTMGSVFDDLFAEATSGYDVAVRSTAAFEGSFGPTQRDRIPASLAEAVAGVEGAAEIRGSVQGFAQVVDADGKAFTRGGAPTFGLSWVEGMGDVLRLKQGRPPAAAGELGLDASTSKAIQLGVGDRVRVLLAAGSEEFEIVGVFGFGSSDNLGGASMVVFDLATAQRAFDAIDEFDTITVAGEEGVSEVELRDRVATVLPAGLEAITAGNLADEQSSQIKDALGFFNIALLVFAGVALFVGAFIIQNTFQIIVVQRMRELGLLRAVGATGGQIVRMVLVEATIVALGASLIGLGLGIGLAIGLRELLAGFGIDLPTGDLAVRPRTVIAGLAVGLGVALVSAFFPARKAARVPAMAALEPTALGGGASLRRRVIAGVLVSTFGVGLLGFGLFGGPSNAIAYVGGGASLVLLGVAVLGPVLARPLAGWLGAPLAGFGIPGRLAKENAVRQPRRTAATASALMIGLAQVSMVAILATSLKASVNKILDESVQGDYLVQPSSAFSQTGFSPSLAERLRALPEAGVVSATRYAEWKLDGGSSKFVSGVDPSTVSQVFELGVKQGNIADLASGGVFVASDVAEKQGWVLGTLVPMEYGRTGVQPTPVVGTFTGDSFSPLGEFLVSLETITANTTDQPLDTLVVVETATGVDSATARAAFDGVMAEFPNAELADQAEFKDKQAAQIDQLLGLLFGLLALSLVIGLLGIVNTLALSAIERKRELGLLRAVGMSRRQVRRMVRWEAVVVSLLGAVLGMAIGTLFGWAIVSALADEGFSVFRLPVVNLVAILVLTGVAGMLAAVLPARKAARTPILEAIAYE